uniref:2Fe-2S ferredoxin-type domain-containing protein n=1 Tax=Salvator merianae TaxID=96440 RepID=A0A8D0BFK2_SALMN
MAQGISGLLRLGLSAPRRAVAACAFGDANRSRALSGLTVGRGFSCTHGRQGDSGSTSSADKVKLHFINRNGEKISVTAKEGESFLEVVMNQNINIDGFGACEGTLACSTCHLIFQEDVFQRLGAIGDDELDMLDLAFGLTNTSRLGCQVHVQKWMDGLMVQVPTEVSDIRNELEAEKQSK